MYTLYKIKLFTIYYNLISIYLYVTEWNEIYVMKKMIKRMLPFWLLAVVYIINGIFTNSVYKI